MINMPLSYLLPAALLQNFVGAELSDSTSHTTEEENRWSKSGTGINIDLIYDKYITDRRSLRVRYNNNTDEYVVFGDTDAPFTSDTWNNPFGYSASDPSWATNVGMWLYMADHASSSFGKLRSNIIGASTTYADITAAYTDEWLWWDGEVTSLSSNANMSRFRIDVDANSNVGEFYINNISLIKRKASNYAVPTYFGSSSTNAATSEYNWKNGIAFRSNGSVSDDGINVKLDGILFGDNITKLKYQLYSMVTRDIGIHNIIERPFPRVYTVNDYSKIKTYMLVQELSSPEMSPHQNINVIEPFVITEVSTSKVPGKPNILYFSLNLLRFTG